MAVLSTLHSSASSEPSGRSSAAVSVSAGTGGSSLSNDHHSRSVIEIASEGSASDWLSRSSALLAPARYAPHWPERGLNWLIRS